MANSDINMERFAHDVCVHVLEKFGIFKAPDDTRRQNKYMSYDFLPCVSRSVVSCTIWIRDSFRNALEDKYKTADPSDKEKMWNFFDDYLLKTEEFEGRDYTGKVCLSLALCTEYIQFVSTKDFTVSLNKLVIRWSDFFEKTLRGNFEAEGGFLKLYSDLKSSPVDQLDNFHKEFISEYCLPYGIGECTTELVKKCAEKHGIPLETATFGVKTTEVIEDFCMGKSEEQSETTRPEESQSNLPGSEERRPEDTRSEASDSEGSSSNTNTSERTDSEMSQNMGSETSDSEISHNNLLGIPPHEEMLREIDPFFVDNIPLPPKPRSASKSPEPQPGSSDAPQTASKSPERQPGSSDSPPTTSKSPQHQPASDDAPPTSSKSPERQPGSNDAPPTASKSPERQPGSNDAPPKASKSLERQPVSNDSFPTTSKSPEHRTSSRDSPQSASESPERQPNLRDVPPTASKSQELEHGPSDALQSSPEQEDVKEMVEQILSKLEHDMEALRALLFEHGLLSMKSGRRGGRMRIKDAKDKIPPKDPEGLI